MDNSRETNQTRETTLGSMVVEKWFKENMRQGLHLEQYNSDQLDGLMISRIRKLNLEGKTMPITTTSLDEIFQSIVDAGLLVPVHSKVAGDEEQKAAKKAAEFAERSADADLIIKVIGLEKAGGQRAVSDWLHHKASKEERDRFNRLYPSGAITPEAPAPKQASLFIVKAVRISDDNKTVYVTSDQGRGECTWVEGSASDAMPLGKTRAELAADVLRHNSNYKDVEIIPVR